MMRHGDVCINLHANDNSGESCGEEQQLITIMTLDRPSMRFTRPWMIDRFGRLIQRTIAKNWWNQLYSVRWASKFQHIVGLQSKAGQPTAVTGNVRQMLEKFHFQKKKNKKLGHHITVFCQLLPLIAYRLSVCIGVVNFVYKLDDASPIVGDFSPQIYLTDLYSTLCDSHLMIVSKLLLSSSTIDNKSDDRQMSTFQNVRFIVCHTNFFTCRRRRRRKNPVRRSCTAELVPTLGAAGFFRAARTDRFLWPSDQSALGDVALRSAPARRRSRPRQYHQLRFHRLPPSPLARFGSICSPPSPSASSRFRIFFISTSASSFSWRSANLLAVDVVQLLLAKGAVFFFGYLAV
ncbi:hypothetical protein T4B_12486 [Trichinella pseudospiralis]|uniref:Uncharacterized protein n=2 Tax=Trichinella pseudospiralis TaxID=6337 RepID=A0A0V1IKW3_TRIPS|nr:hypothetical protein T4B_12486 [Trichinella pseudospiralis]